MDTQNVIIDSEKQIQEFKNENEIILKDSIKEEIVKVKDSFSGEMWDEELSLKIENEVEKKLVALNDSIDLNPTSVYFALKAETALNPEVTEKHLKLAAYKFLFSKTKNKFMKKIFKEKINQLRKGESK